MQQWMTTITVIYLFHRVLLSIYTKLVFVLPWKCILNFLRRIVYTKLIFVLFLYKKKMLFVLLWKCLVKYNILLKQYLFYQSPKEVHKKKSPKKKIFKHYLLSSPPSTALHSTLSFTFYVDEMTRISIIGFIFTSMLAFNFL